MIIVVLYYMHIFLRDGLKELWIKGGKGDTSRYIPVHVLYEKLGSELCSVLPALHSLTGCDITSKVGTKKAAIQSNPVQFLSMFRKNPVLNETDIKMAEQFLFLLFMFYPRCSRKLGLMKILMSCVLTYIIFLTTSHTGTYHLLVLHYYLILNEHFIIRIVRPIYLKALLYRLIHYRMDLL